jgi:hypothetical protein
MGGWRPRLPKLQQRIKDPDVRTSTTPTGKRVKLRSSAAAQPPQLRNIKKNRASDKLNTMQRRFVDNYLETGVIGQSALRAGYSTGVTGTQLLKSPKIQAELERKRALLQKRTDELFSIQAEDVLRELALVAFGDRSKFFKNWGRRQRQITLLPKAKGQLDRVINIAEDFLDPDDKGNLSPEQLKLVDEIFEETTPKGTTRLRIKSHDKMKALNILANYFGLTEGAGRKGKEANDMVSELRAAAAEADSMFPGSGNQIVTEQQPAEQEDEQDE